VVSSPSQQTSPCPPLHQLFLNIARAFLITSPVYPLPPLPVPSPIQDEIKPVFSPCEVPQFLYLNPPSFAQFVVGPFPKTPHALPFVCLISYPFQKFRFRLRVPPLFALATVLLPDPRFLPFLRYPPAIPSKPDNTCVFGWEVPSYLVSCLVYRLFFPHDTVISLRRPLSSTVSTPPFSLE